MLKKLLFPIVLCLITISGFAQDVNIPDANFKAYLLGVSDINTNNDTEIQMSEASAFAGTIYVRNNDILDLTGIEAFTQITQLNCSRNDLTTLDVSNNTQLTFLDCGDNQLTSIDITALTNLLDFRTSISDITNVDLSNNLLLERFEALLSGLTSLDVSNNTVLNHIQLVSEVPELDLTNNNMLELIQVGGSTTTILDLRNGNNTIVTEFEILNAPNLTCIFVDDANYSNTNWTNIDAAANNFVETQGECDTLSITESELSNINIYPNPFNTQLFIKGLQEATSIKIYNVLGQLVLSTTDTSINTNKLSSGLYIITVETENGSISKKIVKK